MSLVAWSWTFLVFYIGVMIAIGFYAQRRIAHADDFATARRSYGPVFLAFAFAASTASGATFLGGPALAYEWGLSALWSSLLYPVGAYFGVLICMRLVAAAGNRFGNRSIPEYLGDRYQSDGIRVLVSLLSLVLFFYLAGQLVSGLVMFKILLGLSPGWSLAITTVVLLVYVVLGGAHADILTDGVQGLMMLVLAAGVVALFVMGAGIEGGMQGLLANLRHQDPNLVQPLNPASPIYRSWWSLVAILIAHIPLGLLPHLGNKLWALSDTGSQLRFVRLAFIFGITMAMIAVAGLLARAILGDALYAPGNNPNAALPMLLIELFPSWLVALIGVAVLSAILSTADGLVVSSSQIIANDLYRRTLVPYLEKRAQAPMDEELLDRRVLLISRVATVGVLLLCMSMAWALLEVNIAIIVWIGIGGMMAAFAGPLVVGALWRGVTRAGAYAGLLFGFTTFVVLYTRLIDPGWFPPGMPGDIAMWLWREGANPFSCAAMGEIVSVTMTVLVSRLSKPLPAAHIAGMFSPERR